MLHARILDAHLETALDVMCRHAAGAAFDRADMASEREVVLEEIAMYEDAAAGHGARPDRAGRVRRPSAGPAGDRRRPSVSSVPPAAVRAYHESRYVGPNIVVAAAGNLEHEPLVHAIQTRFAPLSRMPDPTVGVRSPWIAEPTAASWSFNSASRSSSTSAWAGIGLPRSDRRRFVESLLDSILGGSASSRLFQQIREQRGMAYSVYSFTSQYADTGMVGVYVGTREDNLAECLRVIDDQLRRVGAATSARSS